MKMTQKKAEEKKTQLQTKQKRESLDFNLLLKRQVEKALLFDI